MIESIVWLKKGTAQTFYYMRKAAVYSATAVTATQQFKIDILHLHNKPIGGLVIHDAYPR